MTGMDKLIEKKRGFQKKHIWIILGIAFGSIILHTFFLRDKSSRLHVDYEKITTGKVRYDVFQDYIAVQGIVEPIKTILLDAVEGGRVEEILKEEGSSLKKGEPIIRLSNDNLVLDISNTEAQITRAINESRNARLLMRQQLLNSTIRIVELKKKQLQDQRIYKKNEILFKDQHISEEEYLKSKEDFMTTVELLKLYEESYRNDSLYHGAYLTSLEESVDRMGNNLNLTMKRLSNLTINAPVSGELTSLRPEVGEVINYGNRVGTINILDSYKLKVEIDEHYITRINRGLEGECDFAGQKYRARITKVYPEVRGGRFSVDMEFSEDVPSQIRIGQTTRIRLQLGESNPALLLSRGGFYQSTGGGWLFVIDPKGSHAVKRQVVLGRQNPLYYEVLDGLQAGEEVVISGYDHFGAADKLVFK